jgi:hypothetical protein
MFKVLLRIQLYWISYDEWYWNTWMILSEIVHSKTGHIDRAIFIWLIFLLYHDYIWSHPHIKALFKFMNNSIGFEKAMTTFMSLIIKINVRRFVWIIFVIIYYRVFGKHFQDYYNLKLKQEYKIRYWKIFLIMKTTEIKKWVLTY